ncbi:MAG: hypothetical protein AD073_000272 [Mycoplasmataceae bacterium]|nr:MAG: hypothetical protein AD073_000272 [Mycoplasmataceae bacterium]
MYIDRKEEMICGMCGNYSEGRRTCRICIELYRPKFSILWSVFWILMGGFGFPLYIIWKLFQQNQWDKVNL